MNDKEIIRRLFPTHYKHKKHGEVIKYKQAKGINGNHDFLIDGTHRNGLPYMVLCIYGDEEHCLTGKMLHLAKIEVS